MNKKNSVRHFLQLFAEGGAGDTGVMAPDAGVQGVKQEQSDATAQALETGSQDREAEFQRLIRGEFKDLYDARVQDIVQKRLKGQQKTLEQYQSLEPALELLAQKYGVQAKDIGALTQAIRGDIQGKPVDPRSDAIREENVQLKARQQYEKWLQQTQEARALYPDIQLEKEVQNPRFTRLLGMGLPVEEAYLLSHRHEIIPAAMRYSAKAAEEKLANHIAANGVRPPENGLGSQGAAVVKHDVSKMTRNQRQELIRRVQQGEIIRL